MLWFNIIKDNMEQININKRITTGNFALKALLV